jgi:lipopolysaccharide export system protein LptA
MRSAARLSLAGLAFVALCAAAAPSPAPSPQPAPAAAAPNAPSASPSASSAAPSAVPSVAPSPAASGARTNAPAPKPSAAPGRTAPRTPAPSAAPGTKPALQTPYYKVESDEISHKGNGDFTMPHKVAFSRPGSDGTADRAEGNDKRGTVSLIGNVVIHDNGNAPEAGSEDEYAKGGPATLTCDHLDVDSKAKIYTAIGNVHFEQGDRKADAERGVLNRTTGMLRLQGHVKTLEGASTLRADDIEYNLNTKHFQATGKPIVIKQPVPTPEPGSASPTPKPKKRRIPF